jgi:predicted dehydrogenase
VIVGSDGILQLDPYTRLLVSQGDGWEVAAEQPAFDPMDANDPVRLRAYARQLDDLVTAVQDGHEPLISGEEGRRTTVMLTAAERSSTAGAAVSLEAPEGDGRRA